MKKILINCCILGLSASLLIGCGNKEAPKENGVTDVNMSEEYEEIAGEWRVGAFYKSNILDSFHIIDLEDVPDIADLYDSKYLWLHDDGTFMYTNLYIYKGTYEKIKDSENGETRYLLSYLTVEKYQDGGPVIEQCKDTEQDVVIFIDENTMRMNGYDSLMGKEKANGYPLLFVRNGCESQYIKHNAMNLRPKLEIEDENDVVQENDEPSENTGVSEQHTADLNTYNGILEEYTNIMEATVPRLINEYISESSGISDIQTLAEICNDKVAELAAICNDGVSEMASLMYKNSDDFDTYESWAGELMDNYADIASEIQDAYINSAMG